MCAHGDRRRTRRPPVTRLSRSALLTLLPPTHPTHSPSPLRRELQAQRPPVGAAPLHRCAHEKRECADGAHWSLSERGSGGFGAPPHRAANGARATRGSHGRLRARALCDCGGAGAGRDRRPLGGSAAAAKPAASRSSARRAPPPRARPPSVHSAAARVPRLPGVSARARARPRRVPSTRLAHRRAQWRVLRRLERLDGVECRLHVVRPLAWLANARAIPT